MSASSMVSAKIGLIDMAMLLCMWTMVLAASIKSFGYGPAIVFTLLNVILVVRNTINGLLALLLVFFTPAVSLGLPVGPFVLSVSIIAFKYAVKDFLVDRKRPNFNRVTLLVVLFTLYITFTVLLAEDINLALKYYWKYIEGLILLVIVFAAINTRDDLGKTLKWWAIVAGLALIIKLAHVYFGIDTALFKMLKNVDVGSTFDLEHRLNINIGGNVAKRLLWPGEEPNYSSAMLVFPFAIALAFFNTVQSKNKLFWALIASMIGIAVIGTYSRSGFLAIAAIMVMFVLRGHLRAIIPVMLIGGVFLYLIYSIPQLHDRIFSIGTEVHGKGSGRYFLWNAALDMWLESPFWGKGFSAFYFKYHNAAHNTYLQILAENGVIGLGLFISIIMSSFMTGSKVKKLYPRSTSPDIRFSQVVLFGLIGASLMIATVTFQDIKLYWATCGVCAAMYFVSKRELVTTFDETHAVTKKNNTNLLEINS